MQHRIITILVLAAVTLHVQAQGRRMVLADMPASAVSLAHGGATFGFTGRALVYEDPSVAFAENQSMTHASYDFGLINHADGDMELHTLALSHRSGRHLLMAGARYFSEGTTGEVLDINMHPVSRAMRLYSYGIDVGYGYRFGHFVVHAILGLISDKKDVQDNAYRLSFGATYLRQEGRMDYKLNVAVANLGVVGTGDRLLSLSPFMHGGGALRTTFTRNHAVSMTLDGGAYLPTDKSKLTAMLSGGIDYTLSGRYSVRIGGHAEEHFNYMSAGLGVHSGRFTIDASARLTAKDATPRLYMIGMQVEL